MLDAEIGGAVFDPERTKAAVNAGSTTDSSFASALAYANLMASEFAQLLRPMTDYGSLAIQARHGRPL